MADDFIGSVRIPCPCGNICWQTRIGLTLSTHRLAVAVRPSYRIRKNPTNAIRAVSPKKVQTRRGFRFPRSEDLFLRPRRQHHRRIAIL